MTRLTEKQLNQRVTITCYRKKQVMTRRKAIAYYEEGMLDFFFAIRYLTDGEKEEARKMLYFTSHARAVKQWPNERSRISSLQEAFTRGHLAGMHGWQGDMEMNNVQREVQLRVRLSNMK